MRNNALLFKFILYSFLILLLSFLITHYFNYKYKISHNKERFETQQEIEFTKNIDNLYPNGSITSEGWARHPAWNYRREYIKSPKIWIKEWEFYISYIEKYDFWFSITVSDLGYCSFVALSVTDCKINKYSHIEDISFLPLGNMNLPKNAHQDQKIIHKGKNLNLTISKIKEQKSIHIQSNTFLLPNGQKGININIGMNQSTLVESLNRQTTWAHDRN